LGCEVYLESSWGNGIKQLGYNLRVEGNPGPFFSPAFNEHGDVFVADRFNHRVLIFSRNGDVTDVPVQSSHSWIGKADDLGQRWSNLAASEDRLFLRFSEWDNGRVIDKLGIFKLSSDKWKSISLEPYYPYHSILAYSITADNLGGVYVRLDPGIVYFDADYRAELSFDGLEADETLTRGWDGNMYTYSYLRDHLVNWGPNSTRLSRESFVSPLFAIDQVLLPVWQTVSWELEAQNQFLGTNTEGELYFVISNKREMSHWLILKSKDGKQTFLGEIPHHLLSTFSTFSVAPNGSVYGVTYSPDDMLVAPRIIRCEFD